MKYPRRTGTTRLAKSTRFWKPLRNLRREITENALRKN
jgi:hypothetical protein